MLPSNAAVHGGEAAPDQTLRSGVVPDDPRSGLSLAPFRGLRFTASNDELGSLLCPPYDVIDAGHRATLLASDPHNVVRLILPDDPSSEVDPAPGADRYGHAAGVLQSWLEASVLAVDDTAALYVYEMRDSHDPSAAVTRGLLGAVELRDPEDGVILPHENTMAGPVADRLALMEATQTNLEPIYLVYDGGGAASDAVAAAGTDRSPAAPVATTTTPDGLIHRLWAITDEPLLAAVSQDLSQRRALIADGHHRYATYRQLAHRRHQVEGAGPWDRGLALLVDSSAYGPQVHPIHRVIPGLSFDDATARAQAMFAVAECRDLDDGLHQLNSGGPGFMVVVTDGLRTAIITDPDADAVARTVRPNEPPALLELDVTVLHRVLVEAAWQLDDNEDTVGYAHSVLDAVNAATSSSGLAVLLRPTPVTAVAAVAAAGARMPRKSTFFTPKPASGLVMRRFADA